MRYHSILRLRRLARQHREQDRERGQSQIFSLESEKISTRHRSQAVQNSLVRQCDRFGRAQMAKRAERQEQGVL